MIGYDLLDYECLLDAFYSQNLFRDELLFELNFFPVFVSDVSFYEIYQIKE